MVTAVIPNDYPDFLKWLPGNENILIYEKNNDIKDLEKSDLIFCLDYNAPKRVGPFESILTGLKGKKILIDHHPEPDVTFFDQLISTVDTSSTSELVYNFIVDMEGEHLIDKDIAQAIFVGIMTDTGSFAFNCNYPSTFGIISSLLELGLDGEYIHRMVYDTYSESRLRLLGYCIGDKMKCVDELSMAYIWLTREELSRFNYRIGDIEGVVNYPLSIKNVKVSVMLTERKDRIRLSFRAKGDFAVNKIAEEHFEGGGHRNAAGGDSFLPMEETIQKLMDVLPLYREQIDRSSLRTITGE